MDLSDPQTLYILSVIMIWTFPWKGIALWMAARRSHTGWFIVLLVLNTLAIVDIIYIFLVARRYTIETEETGSIGKKSAEKPINPEK